MVPGGEYDSSLYIQKFSNPRLDCEGDKCGVESSQANSADNVKTFLNTAPLVADKGAFNFENVTPFRYEGQVFSCEKDGLEGFFEATGIYNQTKYDLELASHHFVRNDGTSYKKVYERGEQFIKRAFRRGWGWCVTPETESRLRSEYTESFTRYYHPVTDDVVEVGHLHWEEGYDGEYSLIHVATTTGGTLVGHPQQSVKVGSDHEIHFEPDYGYELNEIRTSCDGTRSGNSFTVTATADNCRLELMFARNGAETATSFVERFYTNLLGRASDSEGLNAWLNVINTQSAAAVAQGFLNSAEFLNKNLDDPAFVDILYRTLFDREGDADGVAFWMDQLDAGKLREMVIWSFLKSSEFKNRSDSFGATALNAADESAFRIRAFVERFYTQVLGRQPDKGGFDYWVSALTDGSYTHADIAKAFFLSTEYLRQKNSDDAFVTTCYRAFFGREPDEGGKQAWMTALGQGKSRTQVMDGFIDSAEFLSVQ